jgi:hypothetical protein
MDSSQSKIIANFIEHRFLPKSKGGTKFSTKSKEIFDDIFRKMDLAETSWEKISTSRSENLQKESIIKNIGEPFPRSSNYSIYPKEIKQEIENSTKWGFIYSFEIRGRKYEVVIMQIGGDCKSSPTCVRKFNRAIHQIYMWLFIASTYAEQQCSRKMNIYIYWTDLKKVLPRKAGEPIDWIHANTAFTTSCQEVTELNIFRMEEWFKVFIHETFHNMGLDFSAYDQSDVNRHILGLFPLKSEVNLFETYCETWAEILNLCFLAYHSSHDKENTENMIKKVGKMMEYERMFSAFQCMKVLSFYGLEYSDLYEKKNTAAHIKRMHKYKESTNILSYYILKSIFMFYADDFLSWCRDHNSNHGEPVSLQFGKKDADANMQDYCMFIQQRYNNPEYVELLHKVDPWFSSKEAARGNSTNTSVEMIRRTMRMTVYG